MPSIEEKVEEHFKSVLDDYGIQHFGKTQEINEFLTKALKEAKSKSGGPGMNYPDIQLLLQNKTRRDIPVMIEAKGSKGKIEKLTKGNIELVSGGKNPNSAVQNFAVNGALHYGLAVLDEGTYHEVIIIGINGTTLDEKGRVKDPEIKAYYVSEKNGRVPRELADFDFAQLKQQNIDSFFDELDTLSLTEAEKENLKRSKEELLEKRIKKIHQKIYDGASTKTLLNTNEKLYLFCGLIMAGLKTKGLKPLEVDDFSSNDSADDNDGEIVLRRIRAFLKNKNCTGDKIELVLSCLEPVFKRSDLWKPKNGESVIKSIYKDVKKEILPLFDGDMPLDFTGKILNSLSDWVNIENDKFHDVVLTPRCVTTLMAKIARTDRNSFVWDTCMGSSGFLISAMEIMIDDAKAHIKDAEELQEKIDHIKHNQLLGIEILNNIFILAVLNMILMGDGSSQIICADSRKEVPELVESCGKNPFPENVFLLNPPYSAPGNGLVFVDEALSHMETGYGAVLIQENAGSGQGDGYSKRILEKNTLIASIHMSPALFGRKKSSAHTAIYLFQVDRPHELDDIVTFIDFSNDGYTRQNRSRSTQEVNLRDTDHALERYEEIVAICLGKKPKTDYYTEANGLVIRDTISLEGNDWTFNQHRKIDTTPTEEDFKKTVSDYLAWKVAAILKGEVDINA